MRINEGSGSGIVDIFFKSKKNNKDDNLWACETRYNLKSKSTKEEPEDEYIMIQNKYKLIYTFNYNYVFLNYI
jgi:hypothetical protein